MSTVHVAEPVLAWPLRLRHLDRLVDRRGIVQFADGTSPALESGYCVDDVARLGIVAAGLLRHRRGDERARRWARRTVHFLWQAYDPEAQALHNLLDRDGAWLDKPHHGDHTGRAIWALAAIANAPFGGSVRHRASTLLSQLLPELPGLADYGLRTVAYAGLGPRSAARSVMSTLDTALRECRADWPWFEPTLTYDNARLPQALLRTAVLNRDRAAADRALAALDWLTARVNLLNGPLRVVGNRWWDRDLGDRGGDEQPLDVAAMVECLLDAWQYTSDPGYAVLARRAFGWFHGDNRAGVSVYDPTDGSCRDGLDAHSANGNRGAESTVVYHQALLRMTTAGLVTLSCDYPTSHTKGASGDT